MSPPIVISVIGTGFIVGGFTSYVASKKGYDGALWFAFGLLFNLVALIAAAGLPIVTDTLPSNTIHDKKEYERLKEDLEIDRKNNLLTDEEIKEKEKELERIKNKLGY